MHAYTLANACIFVVVCMNLCIYVGMHVLVRLCVCRYIYIYTYIYTYIRVQGICTSENLSVHAYSIAPNTKNRQAHRHEALSFYIEYTTKNKEN